MATSQTVCGVQLCALPNSLEAAFNDLRVGNLVIRQLEKTVLVLPGEDRGDLSAFDDLLSGIIRFVFSVSCLGLRERAVVERLQGMAEICVLLQVAHQSVLLGIGKVTRFAHPAGVPLLFEGCGVFEVSSQRGACDGELESSLRD